MTDTPKTIVIDEVSDDFLRAWADAGIMPMDEYVGIMRERTVARTGEGSHDQAKEAEASDNETTQARDLLWPEVHESNRVSDEQQSQRSRARAGAAQVALIFGMS